MPNFLLHTKHNGYHLYGDEKRILAITNEIRYTQTTHNPSFPHGTDLRSIESWTAMHDKSSTNKLPRMERRTVKQLNHKCPVLQTLLKHVSYKDIEKVAKSNTEQTIYPAKLAIHLKGLSKGRLTVTIQSDTQLRAETFSLFQIQDFIQWQRDKMQC